MPLVCWLAGQIVNCSTTNSLFNGQKNASPAATVNGRQLSFEALYESNAIVASMTICCKKFSLQSAFHMVVAMR